MTMGTFLTVIVLLVALAPLPGRTNRNWARCDDVWTAGLNKALFDANDRILALRKVWRASRAELRMQQMHRNGASEHFRHDRAQVTLPHPQAAEVLAGFHLGGCSSCAVDDDDTLAAHLCRQRR
ncbi:MAG: hypothetical protein R2838_11895 [Caldilineaceae bacterium]